MRNWKGLFKRQLNKETGGWLKSVSSDWENRFSSSQGLGLHTYWWKGWQTYDYSWGKRACTLSRCICSIYLVFTLGWKLNIKIRQNLAPDIRRSSVGQEEGAVCMLWELVQTGWALGLAISGKECKTFLFIGWNNYQWLYLCYPGLCGSSLADLLVWCGKEKQLIKGKAGFWKTSFKFSVLTSLPLWGMVLLSLILFFESIEGFLWILLEFTSHSHIHNSFRTFVQWAE